MIILQITAEISTLIAALIGAMVGVLTFIITQRFNRRKLNVEITRKCIEDFRNIVEGGRIRVENADDYLGLLNEELFYIRNKMILGNLGNEWLSNVINHLPVFVNAEGNFDTAEPVNRPILEEREEHFRNNANWSAIMRYPRIINLIMLEDDIKPLSVSKNIHEEYKNLDQINDWKKVIVKKMEKKLRKQIY